MEGGGKEAGREGDHHISVHSHVQTIGARERHGETGRDMCFYRSHLHDLSAPPAALFLIPVCDAAPTPRQRTCTATRSILERMLIQKYHAYKHIHTPA